MLNYKNYNANPKGRKTSDCVIRAISTATEIDYEIVYRALVEISIKTGYMINEKRCYEKLLDRYGFIKHKQPKHLTTGKKYLVRDLDKLVSPKVKSVVVSMAHHLTCVKGNDLIDIWNCGGKTISNFYTLQ